MLQENTHQTMAATRAGDLGLEEERDNPYIYEKREKSLTKKKGGSKQIQHCFQDKKTKPVRKKKKGWGLVRDIHR